MLSRYHNETDFVFGITNSLDAFKLHLVWRVGSEDYLQCNGRKAELAL